MYKLLSMGFEALHGEVSNNHACIYLPSRLCSLENCLAVYSTTYCGVDFLNSGEFSALKMTVLLFNYYPGEGRKSTIRWLTVQNLMKNNRLGIHTATKQH